MIYTQRLHQFVKPRRWTIHEKGLIWEDEDGQSGKIAYTSITSVRLRYEPSRAEQNRYAMRFNAGQEYTITNINYRGIMDFEDQSDDYADFVDSFHQHLSAANPNVIYKAGSSMGAYIGNLILSIFILLVLLGVGIFALTAGIMWLVAVKVAIILFYMPTFYKLMVTNRPTVYDPQNLPAQHRPTPRAERRHDDGEVGLGD